jgi:hypothetical protein
MQDGAFQDGQINHPIGRSIFVFAGGTSTTMAAFDQGPTNAFKDVKGPDFISRLKGFINVLGSNPVDTKLFIGSSPHISLSRKIRYIKKTSELSKLHKLARCSHSH